jgi:hypothetical protein
MGAGQSFCLSERSLVELSAVWQLQWLRRVTSEPPNIPPGGLHHHLQGAFRLRSTDKKS